MGSVFKPILNKLYVFEKYSLVFLTAGQGIFQVDFTNYNFTANKAIFLSPGQYFQLLLGDFSIQLYEFPDDTLLRLKRARFLFKHLISIGHIDLELPKDFQLKQLPAFEFSGSGLALLTKAIEDWITLNPFNTTEQNVNLLFDLKDIIDVDYRSPVDINSLSKKLNEKPYRLKLLTGTSLNITPQKLGWGKMLLEAKRKTVFTDLSTKEIAYETGFKDPAYFNRFFKLHTNLTPSEFRSRYEFDARDTLIKDLISLVNTNFKEQHTVKFYAEQLNMTERALSAKVEDRLSISIKFLIAQKIVATAKQLLSEKIPVNTIGFELGFREPNHFSAFFKLHTGLTPSAYSSGY
jgi:AraC-like DNA-binding protein